MPPYSNQYDNYLTDSDLWTYSTTNGSRTLFPGYVSIQKTGGSVNWNETGAVFIAGSQFVKNDALFLDFSLDDLSTDPFDGTYLQIYLRQSATLSDATPIGVYLYPDGGGIKIHGNTSGVATDLTVGTNMVQGERYRLAFLIDAVTGGLDIRIKGGVFGSSYVNVANQNGVDATAYNNLHLQVNLYSIHSDCSLFGYIWCSSQDPAPATPSNLSAIHLVTYSGAEVLFPRVS